MASSTIAGVLSEDPSSTMTHTSGRMDWATIDAIVDATVKNGPALLEVLKDDGKVTSAWNLDMEWTVSL